MLKPLRNHEAGSAVCRHYQTITTNQTKWRIAGAVDAEKNKVFHDD